MGTTRLDAARVIDAAQHEALRTSSDVVLLRAFGAGEMEVTEYRSTDREGPPPHTHEWDEIEYVIEGEAEFFVGGQWMRGGPGTVQVLPAGEAHSVRVPAGEARILMVTVGRPYAPFARALAQLAARDSVEPSELVATAERHGVRLA